MYFIKVYLFGRTFPISSMRLQSIPENVCAQFRNFKNLCYVVSIAGAKCNVMLEATCLSLSQLYTFRGKKEPLKKTFTVYLNSVK